MVSNLQIHSELKRRFDRVTSNGSEEINTEEWDGYFNEAYRAWVKLRAAISKTNNKVRYDLRKLEVIDKKLKITDNKNPKWIIAELPEEYYDIQMIVVTAKKEGCDTVAQLEVPMLQGDDWFNTSNDPNYAPSFLWRRTFADENSQGLRIGKGDFSIESVNIDYYRKPTPIYSVELDDCYQEGARAMLGNSNKPFELDDMQSDEIIDIAVYYASRDKGNYAEAKSQFEKVVNMYNK